MPDTAPLVNGRLLNRVRSLDDRNGNYPMQALLAGTHLPRVRKAWQVPYRHLDQKQTPRCTTYAGLIALMHTSSAWHRWRPTPNTDDGGDAKADELYPIAQSLDEFRETPPEDGSSGTGAARAMKQKGLITSFYHANSVDDVIDCLGHHGPGCMGSVFTDNMFGYDSHYVIHQGGSVVGGHEYCLDAYEPDYYGVECFGGFMSWGPWGRNGKFYVPVSYVREFLWPQGADFTTYVAP